MSKPLTIRVPKELKNALQKRVAEESKQAGYPVTISTFVRKLLENSLNKK